MQTATKELNASAYGNKKSYFSWAVLRTILYWLFTLPVAFEMIAGAVWDLMQIEYVRVILAHLGYPMYLLMILGVWKFPCALVLLVPGFTRLKEWAYAGAFFTYSGAFVSHHLVGDGTELLIPPLVLAIFTLASWALRPPERWLTSRSETDDVSPALTQSKITRWAIPLLIAAAFLILSFLNVPVGPPPALNGG